MTSIVVGAVGLFATVSIAASNDAGEDAALARLKSSHYPAPEDYAAIPLPIERPPAGAALKASAQVGSDIVTQQMMFQYNGFTVTACAVETSASTFDPCAAAAGETLRIVRVAGWRTTYSASTKFADVPRSGRPGAVIDFFRHVDLAARPNWVRSYSAAYVKELYG